ncbi:MAG TPA: alpha/beta fold hydrolase [Pseudonocardiaceae bacterium]|nr:alpha/beta fold hydrolase [Pseudonocardiaceae bacterium]
MRWYQADRRAAVRLVCCPHAGGAASAFRHWPRWLPSEVDLAAVCYPGREDRLDEAAPDTLEALARPIAAALEPLGDKPIALFGHSMGASVAYEVARLLRPAPVALLVSGRCPPHLMRPRRDPPGTDEELVTDVLRLDPSAAEVLAEPDLRELVLPPIRADYRLVAGYRARPVLPLAVPVAAYGGMDDPEVDAAELARWAEVSTVGCHTRQFPGAHFYLRDHPGELVADLVGQLPVPAAR